MVKSLMHYVFHEGVRFCEKHFGQFISYLVFAGIATIVDFGFLYSLTEFAGVYYVFSAIISYSAGMVTNYSLNKLFTFRDEDRKIGRQFAKFVFVAIVGLGLNIGIIYALVEYATLHYLLARVISLFIVVFWSFSGHKHITFRESK